MPPSVSPINWTGNKSCIYETISAFMPPHRVYIEPCMGSAEVFLRKRPAEKEIINDFNGDLVNFFRVLRSKKALPQLLGRLYLSFNSEELFNQNKKLLASIPNILDDAVDTAEVIQEITEADIEHAAAFPDSIPYLMRRFRRSCIVSPIGFSLESATDNCSKQ